MKLPTITEILEFVSTLTSSEVDAQIALLDDSVHYFRTIGQRHAADHCAEILQVLENQQA